MKDKRGFTLIEVLVSIAIMGILLIITLPQVNKIRQDNKTKKYETYENSIERAAKLYLDSNSKDLFGYHETGCAIVKYTELKSSNLLKQFQESEVKCDNDEETYVVVYKVKDEYRYTTSLVCRKNNTIVYPENKDLTKLPTCENEGEEDNAAPTVSYTFSTQSCINVDKTKLTAKITIKDQSGLTKNISIKYRWYNTDTKTYTKYYIKDFKNPGGIENTNISYTIPQSNIPNDDGHYKLYIYENTGPNRNGIMDYVGNKLTSYVDDDKSVCIDISGPEVPTATLKYDSSTGPVKENNDSWTNRSIWWGNFTSKSFSGIDHYEYSDGCTGEKSNNLSSEYNYTNNWDHKYCIRAVDKAGNISNWSDPYYVKIDKSAPNTPTSSLSMNGHWMAADAKPATGQIDISSFNNTGYSCSDIWWGNFKATDNGSSGIDHYEYSENCTGTKSGDLGPAYHYTPIWNHDYCIRAVDKAGNASSWSDKYHMQVCNCSMGQCSTTATASCTNTSTTTSDWSSCSESCGSSGTKTRTITTTTTCNGTTRTYKQTETAACNRRSCYSIENSSYHVCPSDQNVPTSSVCSSRWYQYDSFEVKVSKNTNKKINVTTTIGMNNTSVTWEGSCKARRICISPTGSQTCKCEIASFSIGSNNWLSTGSEKTYTKTCNVSDYSKGNYRIVVDDDGCSSTRFRFRSLNSIVAFKVLY